MTAAVTSRDEMTPITTYEEAQEILRSPHFQNFLMTRSPKPITGSTIGTLFGAEHLTRRRTEMAMFSRTALKAYEMEIVVPAIRESLDAAAGSRIDLLEMMRDALLRVSAQVIGLDDVRTLGQTDHLVSIAERIGEAASAEWTTRPISEVLEQALEAKAEFAKAFYEPSLARRRDLVARWRAGELAEQELPSDLITVLLKSSETWEGDLLLRECLFYLAASSNTTTHASPHVFAELSAYVARHPEAAGSVHDLGFLQLGVSEALRLHPTVPALLRRALTDHQLASGRQISTGDEFTIDLLSANQDPQVYGATAAVFDPHRVPEVKSHSYGIAFAAGPHTCPGRLVVVGSGTGQISDSQAGVGVLVRLMHELFTRGVEIDPDQPPTRRTDTLADRYATFPVIVPPVAAGAR